MFDTGLFLGEYDHVLDAQGRVTLPSEWRGKSGETELVMIPARGNALVLLPIATFSEFVDRAKKLAIANPKMQMAFAVLGSKSRCCRCDKQGRMALDRKMLQSIGVEKELKLIGALNHIRLCRPDNWTTPEDAEGVDSYLAEIQKISEDSGDIGGILSSLAGK